MNTDRFKFRIFSKVEKRYISTERFVLNQDGELVEPNYTFYGDIHFSHPTENLIVEQCTGLKDANGKFIYEGDILIGDEGNSKAFVENDLNLARFVVRVSHRDGSSFTAGIMGGITEGFLRVVGNIHENPELFDGKK